MSVVQNAAAWTRTHSLKLLLAILGVELVAVGLTTSLASLWLLGLGVLAFATGQLVAYGRRRP